MTQMTATSLEAVHIHTHTSKSTKWNKRNRAYMGLPVYV